MEREDFFDMFARRLNAKWPHSQVPDVSLGVMFDVLKHLPVDQCVAALEVLHREGERFAPTGGMLLKKVAELSMDAPSWDLVKAQVLERANRVAAKPFEWVCPDGWCEGDGFRWRQDDSTTRCVCYPRMVAARAAYGFEGCHRMVVEFVGLVGSAAVIMAFDDSTVNAQCRDAWMRFVRGERDRQTLRGLPSAGLAGLERVNREPRRLGVGVLGQIDQGAGS